MNWEEWAAAVIGGWFIVSTLVALAVGPLLRRRDPDRAWLEQAGGEDRGEAPDDAR